MLAHLLTIDENGGFIVDCTEVKQYILSFPVCRYRNTALIPHAINKVGIGNTAQLALSTEGHDDFTVKSFRVRVVTVLTCLPKVESEGPLTIKILPNVSLELRPRIFLTRSLCSSKFCVKRYKAARQQTDNEQ